MDRNEARIPLRTSARLGRQQDSVDADVPTQWYEMRATMRTYQIALATMIVAITAGGISMAATRQSHALGSVTYDQRLETARAPEFLILAQASLSKTTASRRALNDTASEFENIAKLAINGKSDRFANSLRTFIAAVDKLQGVVPGQTYRNLTNRLSDISEAQKNGDFESAALAAAEGYRTMRLAQDPATLPAPIEVYMLNYTGLKALAIAHTETPDWQRLATIGDETSSYWAEISPKVKQKALRQLMDTVITGFKLGLAQQNVPELRFVVELQLDAVDLIKGDFAKK